VAQVTKRAGTANEKTVQANPWSAFPVALSFNKRMHRPMRAPVDCDRLEKEHCSLLMEILIEASKQVISYLNGL